MRPDFASAAYEILSDLVPIRRELHASPEIGLILPVTQSIVLRELADLGLEIHLGERTTSVAAVLRGGKPGPVVLLRGDMDGLPIIERTGLEFASTNGAMHACGHDIHTTSLIGAARLLAAERERLAGSVIFMFQPGEEGFGGAKIMIDEGLLDVAGERPAAAFGLHVMPGQPGIYEIKHGAYMAATNNFHVSVRGVGGHGALPHLAKDPVPVLAEIVLAIQTFVTREFDIFDPVVVSVTHISAGDPMSIIPESATMYATVRSFSAATLAKLKTGLVRLTNGIASAHGMSADADFIELFPATINDHSATDILIEAVQDLFGDVRIAVQDNPRAGAEDFSFVLNEVPGAMAMVSCSPPGANLSDLHQNHSAYVVYDETVIADNAALLAELAWRSTRS